jgi:hypothetical protein
MTESAQIALLALLSAGIFIELAYIQRTKLARFFGPIARAILPQALYNPAPRLNSRELRAFERRTAARKRQAKQD